MLRPSAAAAQKAEQIIPNTIADSLELVAFARHLTDGASTDSARAAAIYEWIARNIVYDLESYRQGIDGHIDPVAVYRHRIAVCRGFVALYRRLASEVGLSTEVVRGYAKGFDYVFGTPTKRPNHAWLAIRINGRWRLVDPTWGSGIVVGDHFQPAFSWDYFLIDPEVLLLSHLPLESDWQLVPRELRRAEFERIPAVPSILLKVGFAPDAIRTLTLRSGVRDFPTVGVPSPSMRVVYAPLSGTIRRSASVAVQIAWPDASDIAVVSGGVWTPLARAGDIFHGEVVATGGPLYVVGRTGNAEPYQTLLLYRVN
jgi:Transglutaminase-like superfamily